jgi:hypothetical protein
MANPQAFNRYSYVLGNPLKYIDPSGHSACQTKEECEDMGTTPMGTGGGSVNDDREPGEPRCKNSGCVQLVEDMTALAYEFDAWAFYISAIEAGAAGIAYTGATVACLVSELAACVPAYQAAFAADVGTAKAFSFIEDPLGYAAAGLTIMSDFLLGNTGVDAEIGPYVGKDTIVAVRNGALGRIPESFVDFAVSASQSEYDKARESGAKTGGYVPVFSLEFVVQTLFKDWW